MAILSQSGRTIFSGTNVATTGYIYTSAGGSGTTDGWYSNRANHVVVQVCTATLTATMLTYRIEGKFNPLDRPAEVYSATVGSADTIDKLIEVSEHVNEIRVGAKVDNADASPNNFYAGISYAEEM